MRFLMIDRVTEYEVGKSIQGIKCWSLSDEIFLDHFPGYPVVPGVLLTESMAQLMGFLIEKSVFDLDGSKIPVYPILSIIHKAKFRKAVIPGDKCIIKGKLNSLDIQRANTSVEMFVDDNLIAQAELSFVILGKADVKETKFWERHEEYLQIIDIKKDVA